MADKAEETSIAVTKIEGGRLELTTIRIQIYKESTAANLLGGTFGAIGGVVGGIVRSVSESRPSGDGIQLAVITAVKSTPGKGGKGTLAITFVNGKEVPIPDVYDVDAFATKVTEQLAKAKLAKASSLTLDTRAKALPGWQVLQQWSATALAGDPADVRLAIDVAGTSEAMFIRTKDELGDCTVRFVYRFPVVPKFAYAALRVRSDGKNYGLVRLNNKGEFFVSGTAPQGPTAWTKHPALHADPSQPNEAVIELAGGTLRLHLNGTHAVTKDGLHAPNGRIVLAAGADPKPAELAVGAFEIRCAS